MHGTLGPVHIATWRSKLAHKHTLAKNADTHTRRDCGADRRMFSGFLCYCCCWARSYWERACSRMCVRRRRSVLLKGGKSGIREQPAGCARMVAARSGHARRMEANRWSCSSEWPRDTRGDVYRCSREQRGSHVIAPDREYWRSSSLPSKRFGLYRPPPSGAACLDHLPLADRSQIALYIPRISNAGLLLSLYITNGLFHCRIWKTRGARRRSAPIQTHTRLPRLPWLYHAEPDS